MLIQLESLVCVQHDGFILVPLERTASGDVRSFNLLTPTGLPVCVIDAREREVLLALSAAIAAAWDPQCHLPGSGVPSTREYGIEHRIDGDFLYYRYAMVLTERLGLDSTGTGLLDWLKSCVEKAAKPETDYRYRSEVCVHLERLRQDPDFMRTNVSDEKALLIDVANNKAGTVREQLRRIADNWDSIFIDLPF